MEPTVKAFFDPATFTLSYVAYDPTTRDAVVIDPVLDYDPLASQTSSQSADMLTAFVHDQRLKVHSVLETHAHADHLTAAQLLKDRWGAEVAIGEEITVVQRVFADLFDLGEALASDGSQFDRLLKDGERLAAGSLQISVIATPGHTPACVTYRIGDAIFTGDALFLEDYGTGRCDFPGGSAETLYDSVQKLYALPDETRVFVGHDYQPGGREVAWETTIGRSKRDNIQLRASTTKEEFVAFRTQRDRTLTPPRLIFQSVQVNANGGRMPPPHANGVRYLVLPLNLFAPSDDVGVPLPKAAE